MKKLCLIVASTFFVISCNKEKVNTKDGLRPNATSMSSMQNLEDSDGELVLGPQLTNPYTPENMTLALNTLSTQGVSVPSNLNIRITHYYVKFKPQTWEEYSLLVEDTSHVYFDHPLDRDIEIAGNSYHDPEVADDLPTYQYASIEEGFDFSSINIPYEIISPLYIPELDLALADEDFMDQLLDQAYIQTGNYNDTVKNRDALAKKAKYRPGGTILINDNRLNQNIGMEGVLVTARRWFIIFKARPDFNGHFLVNGHFLRMANYRLHFEAPGFNVRKNFFNSIAYVTGPKTTTQWNTTIWQGYNNFAGHVFRGAYRYHYKNISGLLRPIHPSLHFTNYIAKDGTQNWGSGINYGVIPILKVARLNSAGLPYANDDVFSATCHETAHLTHIVLLNNNLIAFASVASIIKESWAVAVEWWLTGLEYKSRGIQNYGEWNYHVPGLVFPNDQGYQYWNRDIHSREYTTLFINCIDTFNEAGRVFFGSQPTGSVTDMIGGNVHPHFSTSPYTIQDLEGLVIKYAVDLTTTSNSLKAHKPANVTNNMIDLLISVY